MYRRTGEDKQGNKIVGKKRKKRNKEKEREDNCREEQARNKAAEVQCDDKRGHMYMMGESKNGDKKNE